MRRFYVPGILFALIAWLLPVSNTASWIIAIIGFVCIGIAAAAPYMKKNDAES